MMLPTVTLTGALLLSEQVQRLLHRRSADAVQNRPQRIPAPIPSAGDLLMQAKLDLAPTPRRLSDDHGLLWSAGTPCRGNVVLSLMDGLILQRFQVSCLTTLSRFETIGQLEGIETWLRSTVNRHAGRTCCPVSTEDARIYYTLEQGHSSLSRASPGLSAGTFSPSPPSATTAGRTSMAR